MGGQKPSKIKRKKTLLLTMFCLLFSLATSILKPKDVHMPWTKTGHQVSNIILGFHSSNLLLG